MSNPLPERSFSAAVSTTRTTAFAAYLWWPGPGRHVTWEIIMARYTRKPLPIDSKKSRRWSLASLGSIGAGEGPVGEGVQLFDLLNLSTGRAHSLSFTNRGTG